MTLLYPLTAGLFGLLAGSFANVCILRIPAGEGVALPASRCASCHTRLRPHELIPLLSFLCLRGRCAHCGARISWQYPIVEASCALLWALCAYSAGLEQLVPAFLGCLFATALLILSVIDGRTGEIPPGISIFIAILGAGRLAWDHKRWQDYLIGSLVLSLPLLFVWLITKGKGVGGGDIKLAAACGLLLGWQMALCGFVLGCILGSIIHLCRMRFFGAGRTLALGPYLAAGFLGAYLWGAKLLDWYLTFIL